MKYMYAFVFPEQAEMLNEYRITQQLDAPPLYNTEQQCLFDAKEFLKWCGRDDLIEFIPELIQSGELVVAQFVVMPQC